MCIYMVLFQGADAKKLLEKFSKTQLSTYHDFSASKVELKVRIRRFNSLNSTHSLCIFDCQSKVNKLMF